jgi:hypothetical protein
MQKVLAIASLWLSASVLLAASQGTRVAFYRGSEMKLDAGQKQSVQKWAIEVLKSANFNTLAHAEVLKQSVTDVQEHYRAAVRGNFVVVTFDRPTKVETVGGEMTAIEIVVGLNRDDAYPSGVFTVGKEGSVVAFEKYAPVKWQRQWEEGATQVR